MTTTTPRAQRTHPEHRRRIWDAIVRSCGAGGGRGAVAGGGLEALEPRCMLDGDPPPNFVFVSYYPEGFSSDTINEFVPITNPNNFDVQVQLDLRYETGGRDQVFGTQTIPAGSRGGFTLSDSQAGGGQGTREGEPYAIIVRATAEVAANFSHYDFSTAIGEGFTADTSRAWSFAEGQREAAKINDQDFILVYNPNDSAATVTMTVYQNGAAPQTFTLSVPAQRRAGWAIDDITSLADGAYGVTVAADVPIVACQSRYRPSQGRGFGALGTIGSVAGGTPAFGVMAGVIGTGFYGDDFYDTNGDDGRLPRFPADTLVSILNTNASAATVKLILLADGPGGTPYARQTISVPASARTTVSLAQLGVPQDTEFSIVYGSDVPVTVTGSIYQGMDATGTQAGATAATIWDFGEGYMSRSRGGTGVLEDLYFFNPGPVAATITIAFYLVPNPDNTPQDPIIKTFSVGSLESGDFKIHQDLQMRFGAEERFYGITVMSDVPVAVMFQHWDSGNGGGFSTFGLPSGTIASLAGLLPTSFFDPPGPTG